MGTVGTRWRGSGFYFAALLACGGCYEGIDDTTEITPRVKATPDALCEVKVAGIGTLDLENDYLPHVVHCENGGANFEALKAQAIAARSVAYHAMKTHGQICDGQGCQVYSCGSEPTAEQRLAVAETAGLSSMRGQALELVREGVIAFEELPRLFSQEMLAG